LLANFMNVNKVISSLTNLAKSVGIDRAIYYTIFGKGFQVLSGPITLILIAHFLSPKAQGFYYTFSSVVALQMFFELGSSLVILQFASHEKAGLNWTKQRTLEGTPLNKQRLGSLLRLCFKWYIIIALLMVTALLPAGIWFLGSNTSNIDVQWQLPWVLVVVSAGGILFLNSLLSFLEGCGLIAEIARMRLFQSLFSSLFLWSAFVLNANLLAAAIPNLVALAVIGSWLYTNYRHFFTDLIHFSKQGVNIEPTASISWQKEIFPLQWKIALTWLSGYFIFFLFTPVLFAFYGPVTAGQMGMSLSVTSAIVGLSISWISTKSSPIGSLIASRKYRELDELFFPALWQSVGVSILGGIVLLVSVFFLQQIDHPFSHRVIDLLPLALLVLSSIGNVYVCNLSVYLRAHKQEPFLNISFINGLLTGLSTYFLGREYGVLGMTTGYLIVNIFGAVIPGTFIFINKRKAWHT
jgi:hypothetical protein